MNHDQITHENPATLLMEKEDRELNNYREAALNYLRVISLAVEYILASTEPIVATWGIAYALQLSCCEKSMRNKAIELNVSTGTISYHKKCFQQIANL